MLPSPVSQAGGISTRREVRTQHGFRWIDRLAVALGQESVQCRAAVQACLPGSLLTRTKLPVNLTGAHIWADCRMLGSQRSIEHLPRCSVRALLIAAPEPHSRVALITSARAAHFPLCAICPLGNKISTRAKTPGLSGTQWTLKVPADEGPNGVLRWNYTCTAGEVSI